MDGIPCAVTARPLHLTLTGNSRGSAQLTRRRSPGRHEKQPSEFRGNKVISHVHLSRVVLDSACRTRTDCPDTSAPKRVPPHATRLTASRDGSPRTGPTASHPQEMAMGRSVTPPPTASVLGVVATRQLKGCDDVRPKGHQSSPADIAADEAGPSNAQGPGWPTYRRLSTRTTGAPRPTDDTDAPAPRLSGLPWPGSHPPVLRRPKRSTTPPAAARTCDTHPPNLTPPCLDMTYGISTPRPGTPSASFAQVELAGRPADSMKRPETAAAHTGTTAASVSGSGE